jgi:hypothetical protein
MRGGRSFCRYRFFRPARVTASRCNGVTCNSLGICAKRLHRERDETVLPFCHDRSRNVTETRPERPSTLRVRLHRERRREGLRLLTLEMPESAINAAIARGFLKLEDSTQAWSVIQSVYATQLSERALNWLTDNGVITAEQRTNPVAILRRISDWLERAG